MDEAQRRTRVHRPEGVTALEYAVIAAAIVPFAIAGFRAIGLRVAALVASVNF